MSTSLYILTNAPHNPKKVSEYNRVLDGLKKMNIEKVGCWSSDGKKSIEGHEDWSYRIFKPSQYEKCHRVEYDGHFMNSPTAVGYNWHLITGYNYSLIYENYEIDWFEDFRNEIFEIVKLLGGSEIIYVADHAHHALCDYLEMAEAGASYDKIRKKVQHELGNPITDYTKLDYQNITEYFLDDFSDLT